MLPYIIVHPLSMGPLKLQPFGLLVAIGVTLGWSLVTKRARGLGFRDRDVQSFLWWMIVGGFVGGHVFDDLLYHPREVLHDPIRLILLWKGLSSFGGFSGATLGGLAWKYFYLRPLAETGTGARFFVPARRATPVALLPYADLMIAAFPVAWIFGRSGCAVVHDHPGAIAGANAWFSVAFGPGRVVDYGLFLLRYGNTPRYDLGLLELIITLFIASGFALTWSRGGAKGYYIAAASIIYAPIRFALDFLRNTDAEGGDIRYASLTPAQWLCIGLLLYGFWVLHFIRKTNPTVMPANGSEL